MASRAFSARLSIGRGELIRIDQRRPCILGQQRRDFDVLAECGVQQLGGLQHQRIDVDFKGLQRLLAGKGQQMLGQIGAAFGGFVDQPGDGHEFGLVGDGLLQDSDGPGDHGQDIVEVVRDAAGQLADRVHLLDMAHLRFRGLLLGQVAADEEMPPHRLRPRAHPVQRHRLSVLVDVTGLEAAHLPSAPRRTHLVARAVEIVGMDELHRALPDHLGRTRNRGWSWRSG